MPYKLDGNCVHKVKSDGTLGETVPGGCHDSEAEARKHMAALNIAMKNEKSIDVTDNSDSTIIGLFLPEEIGNYIHTLVSDRFSDWKDDPSFKLIDAKDYHITLCYLGVDPNSTEIENARATLAMKQPISGSYYGNVGGAGYFINKQFAIYLSVDSPEIGWFRDGLIESLREVDVFPWDDHGFVPHITVAYSENPITVLPIIPRLSLVFNAVTLAVGDNREEFKLGNMKAVGNIEAHVLEKAAYFDQSGNLVIKVVGVPFTGPVKGKADLVGDWFDEKSKIVLADDVIESDFDHGRDDMWLPDDLKGKGFGSKAIGVATMEKGIYKNEEDGIEGRLFDVIVDRTHKYKHMLKKLADAGMLSGSMKMLRRKDGAQKGYIEEAVIGKMSLTPSPMNPNAVTLYKSVLMEAFVGDNENMAKSKLDEVKDKEGNQTETPPVTPATTATQNGSDEKSLVDQIDEIFEENKPEETKTPEAQDKFEKSVMSALDDISKRLEAIEKRDDASMEKSLGTLAEDVQEIKEAFPTLAKRVIEVISGKVTKNLEKSAEELQAESNVRAKRNVTSNGKVSSVIPSNAPGKN